MGSAWQTTAQCRPLYRVVTDMTVWVSVLVCVSLATQAAAQCSPSPCGVNTNCETNAGGAAICRCQPGWDHAPGSNTIEGCPSKQILVFPLLVGLRHSAGQQETERCVVVPLGTRVIPIQGARQTLAHSHRVEPTLFVRGMVTELSAAVLMATLETHLCGAMLTPALKAPVAQMLTVNQMATELCASAGRDMKEIHLFSATSTLVSRVLVVSTLTAQQQEPGLCASASQAILVIPTLTACLTRALAAHVDKELSVRIMKELLSVNAPHSILETLM